MRERSRMPLLLTELVLMLLVFAVCAGVCLELFFSARGKAKDSRDLSRAVSWAQSAAEAYKAANGDAEKAASLIGAAAAADGFVCFLDADWKETTEEAAEYTVVLLESGADTADVRVLEAGKALFSIGVRAVAYG